MEFSKRCSLFSHVWLCPYPANRRTAQSFDECQLFEFSYHRRPYEEQTVPPASPPLADCFDAYLIDLDGVVWVGDEPLPGAIHTLRTLADRGARLVFLANDPRGARSHYAARLSAAGYPANEADIVTSSWATAAFLSAQDDTRARSTFVVGSPALHDELRKVGLRLLNGPLGRDADIVVVGGHDRFGYDELRVATQAAWRGAEIYATNRDATFPMPDGPWPATGAIVAAVEAATGRRALAVGKPEPFMFKAALARLPGHSRAAVIGDRPEVDIAGGNAAGLTTILIGAGVDGALKHFVSDHQLSTLAAIMDES